MGVGQQETSKTAHSEGKRKALTFAGLTYITSYYTIDGEMSSLFLPPASPKEGTGGISKGEKGVPVGEERLDRALPAGYPLREGRFVYLYDQVLV